ncbi:hypothetical protein KC678_04450 [Candidatus Dojkabacteria bacterium]|uniref:Uncharacterized protein n=1 Tax=Candidatus Dojkabacteria bacterium TaxID=2099670 RepID=A0A955L246_9BACT|nr:hypothetical protein [Candidatus Dojkabacteria bacterium]
MILKKAILKKSLLLTFVFTISMLLLVGFQSSLKVTAQTDYLQTSGRSCVDNYVDCGEGKINVATSLQNGDINLTTGINYTPANAADDIVFKWGSVTGSPGTNLCITDGINSSEFVVIHRATGNKDTVDSMVHPFEQVQKDGRLVLRSCPNFFLTDIGGGGNTTLPVVGQQSLQHSQVAGCCPIGYQFVVRDGVDGLNFYSDDAKRQDSSWCCKVPDGASPGDSNYPYYREDKTCNGITGGVIWNEDNDNDPNDPLIINNSEFGINGAEDLGPGSTVISRSTSDLANTTCPASYENGCAVDDTGAIVAPSEVKASNGPICQRCYNTGEAVKLTDNGDVLICTGDGQTEPVARNGLTISQVVALYNSPEGQNRDAAESCLRQGGVYVAIGCIDPSPLGLITGLIRIALGVVGGVALLQIILAGLAYQSGNEEQIQKAQSRVFSTIGGLAVLIFSVLILRIIGVNVLDVVPEGLF